jgi:6-phosphogluconolactonase
VADADELYDDLAAVLLSAAMKSVAARGVFHLALSGGSTPEPFFVRMVIDARYRFLPWARTHVWQVDERCVPPDDPQANIKLIRETLTDHVPMPSRQVHAMPVMQRDPATKYESALREFLLQHGPDEPIPRLDFVLLGMGEDGHTASLFPHSPAVNEARRWVVANEGPTVAPPPRVTMTLPLISAARNIAVLVTGLRKAATVRRVHDHLQAAGPVPEELPITGVRPAHDTDMTWFIDTGAAGT